MLTTSEACTVVMVLYRHNIFLNRNSRFAVCQLIFFSKISASYSYSQLLFGLAKGISALTDVIATGALFTFLSSSRTGLKGCVISFWDGTDMLTNLKN